MHDRGHDCTSVRHFLYFYKQRTREIECVNSMQNFHFCDFLQFFLQFFLVFSVDEIGGDADWFPAVISDSRRPISDLLSIFDERGAGEDEALFQRRRNFQRQFRSGVAGSGIDDVFGRGFGVSRGSGVVIVPTVFLFYSDAVIVFVVVVNFVDILVFVLLGDGLAINGGHAVEKSKEFGRREIQSQNLLSSIEIFV